MNLLEHALKTALTEKLGDALVKLTLTDNRRSLISIKRTRHSITVRLSRAFALADAVTLSDLVKYIKGETEFVPISVRLFMNRLPAPVEATTKALAQIRYEGEYYNLKRIFDSINKTYFDGSVKAKITWGDAPKSIRRRSRRGSILLGSYDKDLQLIRIHPVLDSAGVPPEFIGLVVYHEMLHKHLGIGMSQNGRRMAHTPAFRKLERQYSHYAEAITWEKNNLHKLLVARKKMMAM